MSDALIYDNGGKTFDRYTVIIDDSCYGMSSDPMSPLGFNQYCGEVGNDIELGEHLGVILDKTPNEIKDAIYDRMGVGIYEC